MTDWLTLQDLKQHLNINPDDNRKDLKLAGYLAAAVRVVEQLVGPISPTQRFDILDGGTNILSVPVMPLISVDKIEIAGVGLSAYALSVAGIVLGPDVYWPAPGWTEINTENYVTDVPAGRIVGPWMYAGPQSVKVTYTVGRTEVPPNIKLATLELVAHMWQQGQQGRAILGQAPADGYSVGMAYLIPNRVRQLIEFDILPPGIA